MSDIKIVKWDNTAANPIPNDVLKEILDLSVECKIQEVFDKDCDLIFTWVENGKIVAVAAFKITLFSDGTVLPRFEHIFGVENVRKSTKGVRFMLNVEKAIFDYGFQQMWSYINKERQEMYAYALRFGFSEYARDDDGKYLVKHLIPKKQRRF
jgi:hypothetical protein